MRTLILYATPGGELGAACERYFAQVSPTVAQQYPPHITLTGFFSRGEEQALELAVEAQRLIRSVGPVPADAVRVSGLAFREDWIGLEIESPWLADVASRFAAADSPGPADDAIRLKSSLHLSLAYGEGDLSAQDRLARTMIDAQATAVWELALWERTPANAWLRLTEPPAGSELLSQC